MKSIWRGITLLVVSVLWTCSAIAEETPNQPSETPVFTMIVQDPLSAPLSCPCVEGYAQRNYENLGAYLERKLGQKVKVVFSGSLKLALEGEAEGRADLIIGKNSVVRSDAKGQKIKVAELAHLTDKTGSTKQHGLIVVASEDPAKSISDLAGYDIIFGPADSEEKHTAAIDLFKAGKIPLPAKFKIDQACSDAAAKVVDLGPSGKSAAVISSYAAPLLEGCGTIKKGDLRVLARTKDVPFITAFTTDSVSKEQREAVGKALLEVVTEPELCIALESLIGFVPPKADKESAAQEDTQPLSKKN